MMTSSARTGFSLGSTWHTQHSTGRPEEPRNEHFPDKRPDLREVQVRQAGPARLSQLEFLQRLHLRVHGRCWEGW